MFDLSVYSIQLDSSGVIIYLRKEMHSLGHKQTKRHVKIFLFYFTCLLLKYLGKVKYNQHQYIADFTDIDYIF